MWILRKLTEDYGGREAGGRWLQTEKRKANHKRLLNTENKLRVAGREGDGLNG